MKAVPQRPGPDGSRVVNKRSSIPRLGDNLVAIATHSLAQIRRARLNAERDTSVTLTSKNLDQHTKSTQSGQDAGLFSTPSVSSGDEVILVGRSNQSTSSQSYSHPSLSHTNRGYETPPTTLNEDDHLFFPSGSGPSVDSSCPTCAEACPFTRTPPFQRADLPSPVESHGFPTSNPQHSKEARPIWELHRIFDSYLEGKITSENAKERAEENEVLGVPNILDHVAALSAKAPSLSVASAILRAAEEGPYGDIREPPKFYAEYPLQENRYNTINGRFNQKLSAISAGDYYAVSDRPLHIFVDMSNIYIGFCDSWKISQNIPLHSYIRAPAFNIKVLTAIMRRNRATMKKILVGSVAHTVTSTAQWPQYFVEAQALGYKTSVLSRVQKVSAGRVRRSGNYFPLRAGMGSSVEQTSSSDESYGFGARAVHATRNGEQGVDELLHLNMMDSIIDQIRKPGVMVLATGDAARAEFSDGFLQYATRALDQGWNLELVTWRKTISSAWVNPKFQNKYGHRFRIIYLDDFLEELNGDLYPLAI